ncbi:MAG TPA: phosphatidylglycerol lysyltransferase domain-containing protein [Candidatus Saccharimonadales bacterium]|nr:phosphatidylglycerol lysyltransferase domain-containing protein [Candidatus Saccharimonadales bacterium]
MKPPQHLLIMGRIVGWFTILYGLIILSGVLLRTGLFHPIHVINAFFSSVQPLIGLSYVYLGTLLLRRKFNAWLLATCLSVFIIAGSVLQLSHVVTDDTLTAPVGLWLHTILPLAMLALLVISRRIFTVRSDVRSFRQAVLTSVILLLITVVYGTGGFLVLDRHDLGHEVNFGSALDQTIDQFGLTTARPVAHSRRARVFLDSLPVISVGALVYVAVSFFQPLRVRLRHQAGQRQHVERLLWQYPSDIDDFFKLWPHDKRYYFSKSGESGLAYHVSRGVALVVGDPFGQPKEFGRLLTSFLELCFVNDWLPAFIHVARSNKERFTKRGLSLQKIGEEAIVRVDTFDSVAKGKYFRQIGNRFSRLGYTTSYLTPPHDAPTMHRLQEISAEWLRRPGRAERGFMLGYFNDDYLQQCALFVAKDPDGVIQGFVNLVPTFEADTANYDLLRCSEAAPGNCNDFLLMNLLGQLQSDGISRFNLGLCPLAGLDTAKPDDNVINSALRFFYSNGDRLYSFSGLRRFKSKYEPTWEPRYIAYPGGIRNFTRIITAFNRVSKIK